MQQRPDRRARITAARSLRDLQNPGRLRVMTRVELVQRYAEKTGRDVSRIIFYYVFALFKTAVILQQIYYRYHHGLTKDRRFATLAETTKMLLRMAVRGMDKGNL